MTPGRILKYALYYLFVSLICLELAFWVLGYRPYRTTPYKLISNPAGAYQGDSLLGFRLSPGNFQITLNDSLHYQVTHDAFNQRVIPFPAAQKDSLTAIHFLGCSYTYGYGVNDAEPFPALMQLNHPEVAVSNHAVMGYGLAQAWIILQNYIDLQPNDKVIYCLSSLHFDRTILSQKYRSELKIGFENSNVNASTALDKARFPYVSEQGDLFYEKWNDIYEHWWLREILCTVNFLQSRYDEQKDRNTERQNPMIHVLRAMNKYCADQGAEFIVFCLDTNSETQDLKNATSELKWIEAKFDFSDEALTNHPYDVHPNAQGHARLNAVLEKALFHEIAE